MNTERKLRYNNIQESRLHFEPMSFMYFSQDEDGDFREKHVNDSIVRSRHR